MNLILNPSTQCVCFLSSMGLIQCRAHWYCPNMKLWEIFLSIDPPDNSWQASWASLTFWAWLKWARVSFSSVLLWVSLQGQGSPTSHPMRQTKSWHLPQWGSTIQSSSTRWIYTRTHDEVICVGLQALLSQDPQALQWLLKSELTFILPTAASKAPTIYFLHGKI